MQDFSQFWFDVDQTLELIIFGMGKVFIGKCVPGLLDLEKHQNEIDNQRGYNAYNHDYRFKRYKNLLSPQLF